MLLRQKRLAAHRALAHSEAQQQSGLRAALRTHMTAARPVLGIQQPVPGTPKQSCLVGAPPTVANQRMPLLRSSLPAPAQDEATIRPLLPRWSLLDRLSSLRSATRPLVQVSVPSHMCSRRHITRQLHKCMPPCISIRTHTHSTVLDRHPQPLQSTNMQLSSSVSAIPGFPPCFNLQ